MWVGEGSGVWGRGAGGEGLSDGAGFGGPSAGFVLDEGAVYSLSLATPSPTHILQVFLTTHLSLFLFSGV